MDDAAARGARGANHPFSPIGHVRGSGKVHGATRNQTCSRTCDRRAARGLSHCLHRPRDRRDECRGNRGKSRDQAGNGKDPTAPGSRHAARQCRGKNRPGGDGCLSLRRQTMRTSHRSRAATAGSRVRWSRKISGNLDGPSPSNSCATINALAVTRQAPQECQMMFVRLSVAIAAGSLLSGAALAQAAKPTDPQIAHIAYTAGVIDIAAAKQALAKSSNKEVKAFAQDMVRDHEAVNKQALDLVKKLKVTPEDNDTSRKLSKDAEDKRAELGKLSGAAYDKAYVANEVAYHKAVNGALESTLIPNANNAELKSLLQTGLKIFQGHQQHAEQLASS